jgi:hypothetical protein
VSGRIADLQQLGKEQQPRRKQDQSIDDRTMHKYRLSLVTKDLMQNKKDAFHTENLPCEILLLQYLPQESSRKTDIHIFRRIDMVVRGELIQHSSAIVEVRSNI